MSTNAQALAPKLGHRLALTALLIVLALVSVNLYQSVQGPLESGLAVKQVSDSNQDYVIGTWLARNDVPGIIWGLTFVSLLVIWILYIVKYNRINKLVAEMESSSDNQDS